MKITVRSADINAAVNTAAIAIGSGDESKISTHFLFRYVVSSGAVYILAQDGQRITMDVVIKDATVDVGGATLEHDLVELFTAPAWRLRKWLSTIDSDEESLTIELVDGVVQVGSTKGKGKLGSLDPKDWPYWDQTYADAKEVQAIAASRLSAMLAYAKAFVSDRETKNPALVSVECISGALWATDTVGLSLIKSPSLADATFRIHGKDITAVLSFLSVAGDSEINILEHDRCTYFRRSDSAVLGITRPTSKFPTMSFPNRPPICTFEVKTSDFMSALKFLDAFARKDDTNLYFQLSEKELVVSTKSGSGSSENDEQVINLVSSTTVDKLLADSGGAFVLSKDYLNIVATTFNQDTITLSVDKQKSAGFVTFKREHLGDNYNTMILWVRNA